MKTSNIFQKSASPDIGGSTSSREVAASKRTRFFSLFKKALPLLVLFIWAESYAQSSYLSWGTPLKWEGPYGCVRFDRFGQTFEGFDCIIACKNSTVDYYFDEWFLEAYGNNIEDVEWFVQGGNITSVADVPDYGMTVDWGNGSVGKIQIQITFQYENYSYTHIYSYCVKIIDGPTAYFETEGGLGPFCWGSTIYFDNLSSYNYGGFEYFWDFGDGNYSSAYEPEHIYENPGTYEVTLEVRTRCGCTSSYTREVVVIEAPTVLISCPGLVVEDFSEITYTSENDPCGDGEWKAIGGTIVNGGIGDFATIVWDSVSPEHGFGYIYYHSACGCVSVEKIPVVTHASEIMGETTICVGEQEVFSLPQWATTEFNWNIPDQIIIESDQRNEVIIEGTTPGVYTLKCDYYNTLWDYWGTAELQITIAQKAEIEGDYTEFCSNSGTYTYNSVNGQPLNWVLTNEDSVVMTWSGVSFSYDFPDGGVYMLTASSSEGCESDPIIITVTEVPDPVVEDIEGDTSVCQNVTYQYHYNNTVPGTIMVWETSPGATLEGSDTGNVVNVRFDGTGPYELKVRRRSIGEPECWSDGEAVLPIEDIDVNPVITNDTDPSNTFCPSSQTVFTADFGGFEPDHIQWEVININGNSNFGNVIPEEANNPEVTISWNEIFDNINTGEVKLTVVHCGTPYQFSIPVELYEMPTLTMGSVADVCPGDLTIDITVSTSAQSGTLVFEFGNGNWEEAPVDSSGVYTIANGFSNATTSDIHQTLTVKLENPNGCLYAPSVSETVLVYPESKISVSPGYNVKICDTSSYSHTLTASFVTGVAGTAGFQWYKDGLAITGATADQYTISNATQGTTPEGDYYVRGTDDNGCEIFSNKIYVIQECDSGDGDGCTVTPNPNAVITTALWNCGEIEVEVDYDYAPDLITWFGGEHLTIKSVQGTNTVIFTTDVPGSHPIFVTLNYGGCIITRNVTVVKYYEPQLNIGVVCNSNNTYDITLYNNSVVAAMDSDAITYNYYEGSITDPDNPGTPINPTTEQQVFIPGLSPGTYTYTLILSAPGMPNCPVEQTIILEPIEIPLFTLNPDTFCAEDKITLTIDNYDPDLTYSWWFDNTHFLTKEQTIQVNITNIGTNNITLKAHLPYDCEIESAPEPITINEADFKGSFEPDTINVCEGESFPAIEFEPDSGYSDPDNIIWMQGDTEVGTGMSFTPTESGLYWGILIDGDGCWSYEMATQPVDVTIRKRPFVQIEGSQVLCYEDETTIKGTVAGNNLQRRWLLDGTPIPGALGTWSTTTPLSIPLANATPLSAPQTYEYTLQVQPIDYPTCGNEAVFEVTLYPPLTEPTLDYDVIQCSPYTVQIWVTNPEPQGGYWWSNGEVGAIINVGAGGVYQVTYTAPWGCEITADIVVPEDPERSMWVHPTGCYDICPWSDPQPYIVGPLGEYDYHEWLVNGVPTNPSYNSSVFDLMVNDLGTYQLYIENEGCEYLSGTAYIFPRTDEIIAMCFESFCDLGVDIESVEWTEEEGGMYLIYGAVYNPYGMPITISFSSFNGYGNYIPGSVTIPPGGTYYFPPLRFIPNSGFGGGADYLVIGSTDLKCMNIYPIHFDGIDPYRMAAETELTDNSMASLKVTPNPSEILAAVSYNLGDEYQNAESLKIYSIDGRLIAEIELKENSNDILLDISNWSSGTYIITLQADGNNILQQKLIKK